MPIRHKRSAAANDELGVLFVENYIQNSLNSLENNNFHQCKAFGMFE